MQRKLFKTAPLPFQGQKRRFVNQVKELVSKYPENTIFIDLFGGSGLLSHNIKHELSHVRVIYNDYDNYSYRVNKIPVTNELLAEIRKITSNLESDKKIGALDKRLILEIIKSYEENGLYVDYITLSSSLLFSMNYVSNLEALSRQTFYNCVRTTDYDAFGYLDGLEVVSCDYKELYQKYKDIDNVVFLVDPPYLATVSTGYKDNYWSMKDYLDVLDVLDGTNFIYFTSNKSEIVELCEWLDDHNGFTNPFKAAKTSTVKVNVNHSASYTDMMLFN